MIVLSLLNTFHENRFFVGAIGASLLGLLCRILVIPQLQSRFPKELRLVGEKPGKTSFSLRTRLAFYFNCSWLYSEVWHKFTKSNIPVLVPTLGTRKDVFLPHSSIKWLLSQPANVMGMWDAFNEMFQLGHSLGHEKYMLDTWAVDVTRNVLTQDLEGFIEPIRQELELAIDSLLGDDTENWKTMDILETIRRVVNQAGSRFVVGAPLCRNDDYLTAGVASIDGIIACAGAVGFMPEFLRPLVGRFTRHRTDKMLKTLERYYDPMLQERFAHLAANPDDRSQDPNDLLQRMLRDAQRICPEELNTPTMTRRTLMAKLGFIYQAGYAASNMVRNILESDKEHDTISALREEALRFEVETRYDPVDPLTGSRLWTRRNVAKMVHADSVARETLRLNTVPARALIRQVMVDGVHTDKGLAIPKGSLVCVVSQPMHTDPEIFENPHSFDPYRFVKLRNLSSSPSTEKSAGAGMVGVGEVTDRYNPTGKNWSPHAFLSTSNLLVFGRGRNSCPGRFLVDFQMKMLISYLVTKYDLKMVDDGSNPAPRRPGEGWLLEFLFPPKGVKMMVRRRVEA